MSLTVTPLDPGPIALLAAVPGPDLAAVGYDESEHVVAGEATAYTARATPTDGRWEVDPAGTAPFATRAVLRRPADPASFSGTVVLEWLNVSSGADAAPDYTYLAEEIVRRGHVYVGLSAQHTGVEGGRAAVAGPDADPSPGLKGTDPDRYGDLHHPGDAYCYSILSEVARALRDPAPWTPWSDLAVERLLVVGESQSAFALTTYCNAVHLRERVVDGFLVHSRGGAALPLGEPGVGIDLGHARSGPATRLRDDLDVPVVVVQTETDVLSPRLRFLPARQPDSSLLRTWEVAGAAHADLWQIGEFESFLGCPDPVNRGQQGYVVRAALRHLDTWVRTGEAAPSAPPLEVADADSPAFLLDDLGNAVGGVRTPCVDAPVQVLSGLAVPGAPVICQLFGRTLPADPALLRARYASEAVYLEAYESATDAAIAAGFVLPEDRTAVLTEARPDLIP